MDWCPLDVLAPSPRQDRRLGLKLCPDLGLIPLNCAQLLRIRLGSPTRPLVSTIAGYARRTAPFETLHASGTRIGEALTLPTDAAPSGTRMLPERGKGHKQHLLPLHEGRLRLFPGGAPPWLFHSVRNGAKALTRQVARLAIKEATVAAGLANPDRVSPHVLRHTFASHMHSNSSGPTPT